MMKEARVQAKISARPDAVDGAVSVRRALPVPRHPAIGPFVLLDQLGPIPFAAGQGMDVPPHPHIGLATVTYLYEGALTHRDSLGYDQVIRPGDVNWMRAGRGIVHSERTEASFRASGGSLFGIQAWLALPRGDEDSEPAFHHYAQSKLPLFEQEGLRIRVLAGSLGGRNSPVEFPSSITFLDVLASVDRQVEIPRTHAELAVYVASGVIEIGSERFERGDLCVLGNEGSLVANALTTSRFLVLGGEALDGPRHMVWNFVSSRRERIEQAKDDWRRGRFDPVVGDAGRAVGPE